MRRILLIVALACIRSSLTFAQAVPPGPTTTLRGDVYDSVHHAPVANATVVAIRAGTEGPGTVTSVVTDQRGQFEFAALAVGRYTISVEDAAHDSAGLAVPDVDLTLAAGAATAVTLATPSRATRVRIACGNAVRDSTLGAIVGVVSDGATGRPLGAATLVLQWSDFTVDSLAHFHSRGLTAAATTGADGAFRVCGVPAQRSMFLQAQSGQANSGIVEGQINESGVLVSDFTVWRAEAQHALPGTGAVEGVIVDPNGHPVKDGRVVLIGTTRSLVANDAGRFHFDSLPLGTQQLEVLAVGFYPARFTTNVAPGASPSVTVRVEALAVVLDSMRVVANAANPMFREFEQRRKQGTGMFFTDADIAKRPIFDLSDFFMVMPHLNAHVSSGGQHYFTTKEYRGISTLRPSSSAVPIGGFGVTSPAGSSGGCSPAVIIDGTPSDVEELDQIPPSMVHGIEVYGGYDPVPAKYRFVAGANCGAIIVWTK